MGILKTIRDIATMTIGFPVIVLSSYCGLNYVSHMERSETPNNIVMERPDMPFGYTRITKDISGQVMLERHGRWSMDTRKYVDYEGDGIVDRMHIPGKGMKGLLFRELNLHEYPEEFMEADADMLAQLKRFGLQ